MRAVPRRPPSVASAVARFTLGSVAALAVVLIGGFFALRSVAIREAERDTRQQVQSEGRLVEAVGLGDGVLRGDPDALARLDDVVAGQILEAPTVRVKLWSADGRILYSDEPALIGRRYRLGDDERRLLREGGAEAELSDLSKPENSFERSEGKLLEAHTPIRTPDGSQVLFEIYQRFESVSASAERLLGALAPPLLGGLAAELRLRADDGAIEIEFRVHHARVGGLWRVTLVRERRVVRRGRARTGSGDDSFRVRRRVRDLPGADRVTARTVGPRGLTCAASAVLPGR